MPRAIKMIDADPIRDTKQRLAGRAAAALAPAPALLEGLGLGESRHRHLSLSACSGSRGKTNIYSKMFTKPRNMFWDKCQNETSILKK